MFNYAAWFHRAAAFVAALEELPGKVRVEGSIQPPLDDRAVDRLAKKCHLPIPGSLRRLWTTAARGSDLRYAWTVADEFQNQLAVAWRDRSRSKYLWGGPEFLPASEVAELSHSLPSWAEGMRPQYPKDARIWDHSLALIPVGNGDHVGLYLADESADPPVVYMCHEGSGGSKFIAANLDEFLHDWEKLDYIGIDFLMAFCGRDTDALSPSERPVQAEALRTALRGKIHDDLVAPPLVESEQDWQMARTARRMLQWLEEQGLRDSRKLRLYCCACCKRVWSQLSPSGQRAVEASLGFADGLVTKDELSAARRELSGGIDIRHGEGFMESLQSIVAFERSQALMHHEAYEAVDADWWISESITSHLDDPKSAVEKAAHAELVRHIFGNPFRPMKRPPIESTVVMRLAQRLYGGEPVTAELKEALQGAGAKDLAEHFQSPDHPPGCWALDLILGE